MKEVKDLIVENCHLQVSIIIVGIGEDDFDKMIELDGDDIILTDSKNKKAVRDWVQFVKYNDFSHSGIESLAEEVLREVPEQVISHLALIKTQESAE